MARTNFSFQKRQKELAKQKKREEKLARKLEKKAVDPDPEADSGNDPDFPEGDPDPSAGDDVKPGPGDPPA